MKILVTETAGFIDNNLVKKLLKKDYTAVGLDNINDYYHQDVKYGRLQKIGIINSLDEEEDIPYGKLLASSTNSSYKFIKLNLENKDAMIQLFKEGKFDAVRTSIRHSLTNTIESINVPEACRHNNEGL